MSANSSTPVRGIVDIQTCKSVPPGFQTITLYSIVDRFGSRTFPCLNIRLFFVHIKVIVEFNVIVRKWRRALRHYEKVAVPYYWTANEKLSVYAWLARWHEASCWSKLKTVECLLFALESCVLGCKLLMYCKVTYIRKNIMRKYCWAIYDEHPVFLTYFVT
jgi:hypothetical protein